MNWSHSLGSNPGGHETCNSGKALLNVSVSISSTEVSDGGGGGGHSGLEGKGLKPSRNIELDCSAKVRKGSGLEEGEGLEEQPDEEPEDLNGAARGLSLELGEPLLVFGLSARLGLGPTGRHNGSIGGGSSVMESRLTSLRIVLDLYCLSMSFSHA